MVSPEVPATKKRFRNQMEEASISAEMSLTITEEPALCEVPSSCQAAQTQRPYTFIKADLFSLLNGYERFVEEETEARYERIPQETALPFVRRGIREGKQLSTSIQVVHPLTHPHPLATSITHGRQSWGRDRRIRRAPSQRKRYVERSLPH